MLKILFEDESLVAIHKPAGFHVHPHEDPRHRVARDKTILYCLRDQLGKYLYPVHRLDAATSGVLVFALDSTTAAELCRLFELGEVEKTYHAVCRGLVPESGSIDLDLELDSTGDKVAAHTKFHRMAHRILDDKVGKRQIPAHFSYVEVQPLSGRFHQIRRHFNRISHPLIGDAVHGDSHNNRYFREKFGLRGLCLRATSMEFHHPKSRKKMRLESTKDEFWSELQKIFYKEPIAESIVCPIVSGAVQSN